MCLFCKDECAGEMIFPVCCVGVCRLGLKQQSERLSVYLNISIIHLPHPVAS